MSSLESTLQRACAEELIPGAVLLAKNRDGSFQYSQSFGKRSVRAGADQSPLRPDTVMWIASCTKLMTSIAAMQCVERGLLSLDAGIYDILPEFKSLPLIKGFNKKDGSPILEPHKTTITLRHLLTHSSGLAYDETHPKLLSWLEFQGKKPSKAPTVGGRFLYPLVFEPGTSWVYGSGVDWAGKMVERVNGGVSLEKYMEENIWKPLGIKDMTFFLSERPDLEARLADMSKRDPNKPEKVIRSNARLQFLDQDGKHVTDCFGGLGAFASPEEYVKVVHGLLTTDETGVLLKKKESVEEFFKPQLGDKARKSLAVLLQVEEINNAMGGTSTTIEKDWGLGGLLSLTDVEGGRRSGTMTWGGLPNLTWFVDRKTGLCGLYSGQVLPPGDPECVKLHALFEETMYQRYRGSTPKL